MLFDTDDALLKGTNGGSIGAVPSAAYFNKGTTRGSGHLQYVLQLSIYAYPSKNEHVQMLKS